jgi:hypothetical protein
MELATLTMPICDERMAVRSPTMYVQIQSLFLYPESNNEQVKYWALGNECWGPWQVEQMTKEAYAHKAIQWAKGNTSFYYSKNPR